MRDEHQYHAYTNIPISQWETILDLSIIILSLCILTLWVCNLPGQRLSCNLSTGTSSQRYCMADVHVTFMKCAYTTMDLMRFANGLPVSNNATLDGLHFTRLEDLARFYELLYSLAFKKLMATLSTNDIYKCNWSVVLKIASIFSIYVCAWVRGIMLRCQLIIYL